MMLRRLDLSRHRLDRQGETDSFIKTGLKLFVTNSKNRYKYLFTCNLSIHTSYICLFRIRSTASSDVSSDNAFDVEQSYLSYHKDSNHHPLLSFPLNENRSSTESMNTPDIGTRSMYVLSFFYHIFF